MLQVGSLRNAAGDVHLVVYEGKVVWRVNFALLARIAFMSSRESEVDVFE